MLRRLFGSASRHNRALADAIYKAIVAASRQPELYSGMGIPDTPLGRFEAISLHMVLFLRRAKSAGAGIERIAQLVTEEFFSDVDYALRELGIGDTSVPKRMKKLAQMFYGRAAAYTAALDAGDGRALEAALTRNIMPDADDWPCAPMLAHYMQGAAAEMENLTEQHLMHGKIAFVPLSGGSERSDPGRS